MKKNEIIVVMLILAAALALSALLPGCATSGLSGTTTVTTTYNSDVGKDGAEKVNYNQTVKGKAGDVVKQVSSASLVTNREGRNLSVGSEQNNDATHRADTIAAVNQQWADAFTKFTDALTAALTNIAGVAGAVKQAEATAGVEKVKARTGAASAVGTAAAGALKPASPLTDLPAPVPVAP